MNDFILDELLNTLKLAVLLALSPFFLGGVITLAIPNIVMLLVSGYCAITCSLFGAYRVYQHGSGFFNAKFQVEIQHQLSFMQCQ